MSVKHIQWLAAVRANVRLRSKRQDIILSKYEEIGGKRITSGIFSMDSKWFNKNHENP